MKLAKRCKRCDKVLRIHNKSGYCTYHYAEKLREKKRREERLIYECIRKVIDELFEELFGDEEDA